MINIQFTTPQEMADVFNRCISYGMAISHPDITPPEHPLKTIFALPVKPQVKAKPNNPKVPPIKFPPAPNIESKERLAAAHHWKFILMRNEWARKDMSEEAQKAFIKEWLKHAENWYRGLSPAEQYGLMRGPNVWLYSQCTAAWAVLSSFDKCNICKRAISYKITRIKEEFLPPDIKQTY